MWVEMPLPGEVIDFINRKALSREIYNIRRDKIIDDGLTYMDEVGVTKPVDEDINETIPEKLKKSDERKKSKSTIWNL